VGDHAERQQGTAEDVAAAAVAFEGEEGAETGRHGGQHVDPQRAAEHLPGGAEDGEDKRRDVGGEVAHPPPHQGEEEGRAEEVEADPDEPEPEVVAAAAQRERRLVDERCAEDHVALVGLEHPAGVEAGGVGEEVPLVRVERLVAGFPEQEGKYE
jgi:hypothetical protein